jgi:hypothetical protein
VYTIVTGWAIIATQLACSDPIAIRSGLSHPMSHQEAHEVREIRRVTEAAHNVERTGKPGDMDQLTMIMAIDGDVSAARGMAIYTLGKWEGRGFVKPNEVDDTVVDALKKLHGTDIVDCITAYALGKSSLQGLDDEKRRRIFKQIHQDKVNLGFSDEQRKDIVDLTKGGTYEDEVFVACIAASKKKIDPADRTMLLKAFPTKKSGDTFRDRFRRLMVKVIEAKSHAK